MKTRVCTKCNKEYPLDKEHFRVNPRYLEGFKRQCNWCSYTPEYGRRKQLERRHKMTPAEYDTQLAEQENHCALCAKTQGEDKRRMAVDHDHKCCDKELACGKCNRGILCADCNRMVGFLEQTLRDALVFPFLGKSGSWTARALRYLLDWEQKHRKTQETQ